MFPLCRDAVGLFYNPSQLGHQDTRLGNLTPQKTYSRCILQRSIYHKTKPNRRNKHQTNLDLAWSPSLLNPFLLFYWIFSILSVFYTGDWQKLKTFTMTNFKTWKKKKKKQMKNGSLLILIDSWNFSKPKLIHSLRIWHLLFPTFVWYWFTTDFFFFFLLTEMNFPIMYYVFSKKKKKKKKKEKTTNVTVELSFWRERKWKSGIFCSFTY